jgi:hypothetical protein
LGGISCSISSTFGIYVPINEFYYCHRGHISIPEAGAQNANVTTLTLFIAWSQNVKKFGHILVLFQLGGSLTTSMKIATLSKRDELFNDRAKFFCLWYSGFYLLMFDKRTGHIGPERLAVLMGSIKAAIASSVTHVISPFLFFALSGGRCVPTTLLGAGLPSLFNISEDAFTTS